MPHSNYEKDDRLDEETVRSELQELRNEVVVLRVSLGILLGALRAAGAIGDAEQFDTLAAIKRAGAFAPVIERTVWSRTASLIEASAQSVTLQDGCIVLKPE